MTLTRHANGEEVDADFINTMLGEVETLVVQSVPAVPTGPTTIALGDVNYDFRHADSGKTFLIVPAPGVTRNVAHHTYINEQAVQGDIVTFVNGSPASAPGFVSPTADSGVTLPGLPLVIGPGERFVSVCTGPGAFTIIGGHAPVSPTAPPLNLSKPTINYNGTTTFSVASAGAWNPAAGTTFRYQWQRGTSTADASFSDRSGETALTYTKVSGDEGTYIRVLAWATNGGVETATPVASVPTFVPTTGAPINTVAPKFTLAGGGTIPSNTVEVGQALVVNVGTYSPAATSWSVEVFNRGSDGVDVSRGVDTTSPFDYTPQAGDTNEDIWARVIASNGTGTAPAISTVMVHVVPAGTLTGGGSGGSSGSGARDAALQPFASTSPWNTPIGTGARFGGAGDARTIDIAKPSVNINSSYYSIPITMAAAGDPTVTVTDTKSGTGTHSFKAPSAGIQIANGFDQHGTTIDPTHSFVDEAWAMSRTGTLSYNCGFFAHSRIDEGGTGFSGGVRASFFSVLGGLIRKWEADAGAIKHALVIGIPQAQAKRGFVWPATSEDAGNSYAGNIPLGTLFAIPNTVDLTTLGLSAAGLQVARALQNYGGYVGDTTTSVATLCAEPSLEGGAWLSAARGDAKAIFAQLRPVTNSGPTSIGGGAAAGQPAYINGLTLPPAANSTLTTPPGTATTPALDDPGDTAVGSGSDTFLVWGHQIGTGPNRVELIAVSWASSGTCDTINLRDQTTNAIVATTSTQVDSVSAGSSTLRKIALFKFVNPPSGTYNVEAVFTTSATSIAMQIESLSSVDQATPLRTVGKATTTSGNTLDVSTTGGAASDLILAFGAFRTTGTASAPIGQTSRTRVGGSPSGTGALIGTNLLVHATSQAGGTGTQHSVFNWTGAADVGAAIAVAVKLAP